MQPEINFSPDMQVRLLRQILTLQTIQRLSQKELPEMSSRQV